MILPPLTLSGQHGTALVQCCRLKMRNNHTTVFTEMANHKSAIKRIRTNERKRLRNRAYHSRTRTQIKKARVAIETENVEDAVEQTREAIRLLDKAANKGVIHKRNAARRKSRLMRQLNALQVQ